MRMLPSAARCASKRLYAIVESGLVMLLLPILAGCASSAVYRAYDDTSLPPEKVAKIVSYSSYHILQLEKEVISIIGVDGKRTVSVWTGAPSEVCVLPGSHVLQLEYESLSRRLVGNTAIDAQAGKTYCVRMEKQGDRCRFRIVDVATIPPGEQSCWVSGASGALSSSVAPIFTAIEKGDTQEVARLLAAGTGLEVRGPGGATPLGWAAAMGSDPVVELLIARGAEVNAGNQTGLTPLHGASYHAYAGIAERLIRQGANVNARSVAGETPLHKALERFSDPQRASKMSPAEVAAAVGMVKLLVANGAEVNAASAAGWMPLHDAAYSGQLDLVEMLLKKGAEVNAKGSADVTPLHQAAQKDSVGVVESLIASGAVVNARAKNGYTPLTFAARDGNSAVAKVLLGHGAEVDAKDMHGNTPLLILSLSRFTSYMITAPSPGMVEFRKRIGVEKVDSLQAHFHLLKGQWHEVALLLIQHGADVNVHTGGDAPLGLAAFVSDPGLVAALLEKGAAVNWARGSEATPLLTALAEGHADVAGLLIGKQANVMARSKGQQTPLHYLAQFMDDGKLAELLLQHGAEVNAKDRDGETPLAVAVRCGHNAVAEVLRGHGGK